MFNGNCEEAFRFYKKIFEGQISYLGRYKDGPMKVSEDQGSQIMHTELRFWGGSIMGADNLNAEESNTISNSNKVHLSLHFENVKKMQEIFDRLKEDGKVIMDLQPTFWGDKFGMLMDKFGISWMLNCPLEGNAV